MKTTILEETRAIDNAVDARFMDRMLFPALAIAIAGSLVLALMTG